MHGEVLVADPTPFVVTHLANHVWTPTFFFNTDTTVLAHSYMAVWVGPVLVLLVNDLLTALSVVRCVQALEAVVLVAVLALNILAFKSSGFLQISFAISSRTAF